jgi:signal transduction histidine kinase/CheY-like chemotaxis protein
MSKTTQPAVRYGVAVLTVVAALACMGIPEIGKELGSLLFLAVLISAWYGGLGPGLLATALITVIAVLGVVNQGRPTLARTIPIGLFSAGGVLIALLVEALHAARRRIEGSQDELRRRVDELAAADARKDEFLAMLAHELRNPMAAIKSAVELSTQDGRDQIEWCMDVVGRQVNHLARLVDDLLDAARFTQGKIRLRTEPLDVARVVRGAIEAAKPAIETRRHKLSVAIAPGPMPAVADPVRLEQIVTNLLSNAAKYTESGGAIWLLVARDQGDIVIKVRDTGIGIAPEQIERIFELFAQGDRSLARSDGGLGIGLPLARKLAEMHGGSLTAKSDGPGAGSEFVVRLPAAPAPAGATPPAQPLEPPKAPGRRVLVVDDNIDMARTLSALLRILKHEVWTAHDGPTGLDAARAHRPEVMLLDIGLPGMDGYQVAEEMRRQDFGKDALLIAVTGYGQDAERERAFRAGFDHFVTKPIDSATLQALLVAPEPAVP